MATEFKIEHVWPVPRDIVLQHILDEELADRCNDAIQEVTREPLSPYTGAARRGLPDTRPLARDSCGPPRTQPMPTG